MLRPLFGTIVSLIISPLHVLEVGTSSHSYILVNLTKMVNSCTVVPWQVQLCGVEQLLYFEDSMLKFIYFLILFDSLFPVTTFFSFELFLGVKTSTFLKII
jgi:hypothetical protein